MTKEFIFNDNSKESRWRSLILFGKNTSTYKFGYAKSLFNVIEKESTAVILDELALPYANYIIEHLKFHDKQGLSSTSKFLDACRARIKNKIDDNQLHAITMQEGFKYVVDAFQNLSGEMLSKPFYTKNVDFKRTKKLTISDDLLSMKESFQYQNLFEEIESRWHYVELAWAVKVPLSVLDLSYEEDNGFIHVFGDKKRRRSVTNARSALMGYQKGQCFYCCDKISIDPLSKYLCRVDHFIPYIQKKIHQPANIDGYWNLVLACQKCNGPSEKWDRVADEEFLNKLIKRNEFYIGAKRLIAEIIIQHTGATLTDRLNFLKKHYQLARDFNQITPWKPKERYPCLL